MLLADKEFLLEFPNVLEYANDLGAAYNHVNVNVQTFNLKRIFLFEIFFKNLI